MCLCRAHYLMLAVVVLLGVASLLGGCGAKGPLYLPKTEQKQTPPKPQSQTQPQNQPESQSR